MTENQNQTQEATSQDDPFAPDAPIHHLLSIKDNPRAKDMTSEQLQALIKRMRTVVQSPQTMTSELQRETRKRKKTPEQLRREAILAAM